jgi:hypothetical protein
MTKPPYNPPGQGPTLLYIFQSYLPEGGGAPEAVAEREAAAARLTREYEDGKIEVGPALKPGARFVPKAGPRLPRLVADVRVEDGITTRIKVPSETEFYYGPPRLDVVDVDGTRTPAENFYGRLCLTLPPPPPPYVPPRPAAEPVVSPEILQQLTAAIAAQLAAAKPSLPPPPPPPPAPEKSKLEEKLGRPVVVQLRAGEHEAWLEIVPHLKTLYDADKLPNESAARREVAVWLRTDTKKRTMARSTIHVGVKWHCVGWWDDSTTG